MARIAFPLSEVRRELEKLKITPERFGYYRYDHYRVYKRVEGKFIPYGWNVESRPMAVEQFNFTFLDSQLQ
tara:strand:- start:488 stop:700 length:213 start_codon:yes stop_codon:yes gene_type:complete